VTTPQAPLIDRSRPKKRLRVVFMGTPLFALPSFEAVAASEEVIAVVTQPDRPQGRGLTLLAGPIKAAALNRSLPIHQPQRIRKDPLFIEALSRLAPDLIVVVAFGQILPEAILKIPSLGCINVHASLLPKYRGAAPIQWALIRGERETGVTTMQMDVGMDTGPILLQSSLPIAPDETAAELSPRLAQAGADLLIRTLSRLKEGRLVSIPQDPTQATSAPILKKEDGKITWEEEALSIFNRWRGMAPWPGSTTYYGGERLKVLSLRMGSVEGREGTPGEILGLSEKGLEVAAGLGYILIERLQPEGGKSMTPKQYAAGRPIQKGSIFTS
jgi:methionyl-tRNA formyltransferase